MNKFFLQYKLRIKDILLWFLSSIAIAIANSSFDDYIQRVK